MAKEFQADPNAGLDEETQRLAQAALAKRKQGKEPNSRELAALQRVKNHREEQDRWRYYQSIPKKHWQEMSGRQHKTLGEQAARYGIPISGPTIDLRGVARWIHDFLAENGPLLLREQGPDALLRGDVDDSPALEKLREESYKYKRLERLEKEKTLLPRQQVHAAFVRVAACLRAAGEQLQKQHGPDALDCLNESLDDAQRELESLLGQAEMSIYSSQFDDLEPLPPAEPAA